MAKYKPYGKYLSEGEVMHTMRASDFDRNGYKSLSVWNTHRNDKTALVIAETNPAPFPYSVIFGFSRIVFDTLKNAESFCKEHGFTKIKENVK